MATPAAVLNILVTANTAQANTALTKTNANLEKTAATSEAASGALTGKLARGAKLAGAAVAGLAAYGLYKGIQAGMTFEKQMSSLGAVSEASAKQMKKLEKQALDLGEATEYTANQVAEAQTELAKGGLTVKQIIGGALPAALDLAAAGELELAEAAETTVNVMKLFGLEGKNAGQIADMLATAANKTTADVSDFAMALKQGGSVAHVAGLNLNQTVTVLEALAEAGIKNSDAGTSMKTAFIQLIKPSTKQAELAKELGLSFETQAGTMKGAVGISKELHRATDGMTKAERLKTLATLAGTDGVRTLTSIYAAGPKKLEAFEKANKKQGTAADIARKKMDNLSGDVEQLTGALEVIGIKLYKLLAPSFRTVVQGTTEVVKAISNFDYAGAIEATEEFVVSLEPLWEALKEQLEPAFENIKAAAMAVGEAFANFDYGGAVEAVESFVSSLSPVWDIVKKLEPAFKVLGIALLFLLAPGVMIAANFDKIKAVFEAVGDWISRAASNIKGFLTSLIPLQIAALGVIQVFNKFMSGIRLLLPVVETLAKMIRNTLVAAFGIIKVAVPPILKVIGDIGSVIGDVVALVSHLLRGEWGAAWRAAKELVVDVFHTWLDIIKGGWTIIKGYFKVGTQYVKSTVHDVFTGAVQLIKTAWGQVGDFFEGLWGRITGIFETGLGVIEDVIDKILDVVELIPGVDIRGSAPGPAQETGAGSKGGKHGRHTPLETKARGGPIFGGSPNGDTIPAMLERGEYVVNRKAVEAIGQKQLDTLNFGAAPRFSHGGPIGQGITRTANAVGDFFGGTASDLIGHLPTPHLPAPFTGLGPYLINKATEFIKGKKKKLGTVTGLGAYTGAPANMKQLGDNAYVDSHTLAVTAALDKMFGLTMSSGYRTPEHNAEIGGAPGSLHTHGSFANPGATDSVGQMGAMRSYIAYASKHVAGLKEAMIDNYAGLGYNAHLGFFARGGPVGLRKGGGGGIGHRGWRQRIKGTILHPGTWQAGRPHSHSLIPGESEELMRRVGRYHGGHPGLTGTPGKRHRWEEVVPPWSMMMRATGPYRGGHPGLTGTSRHRHHWEDVVPPWSMMMATASRFGGAGGVGHRGWRQRIKGTILHPGTWAQGRPRSKSLIPGENEVEMRHGGRGHGGWSAGRHATGLGPEPPVGTPAWVQWISQRSNLMATASVNTGNVVKTVGAILQRNGLDRISAAGILGNAWGESEWIPGAQESESAGGLWGFTTGEKSLASMKAYAASQGVPWTDVTAQTQFMLHSLPSSMRSAMNDMSSVDETTKYFMDKWEIPGIPAYDKRLEGAKNALSMLGGSDGGGGGGASKREEQKRQTIKEAKKRKARYEDQLKKLRGGVGDAKTTPARIAALWKLIKFWGRVGIFGDDEKAHILDSVQMASSLLEPKGQVKVLQNLAEYALGHGEITGRDPENFHAMTDAITKAQERGKKQKEHTIEKHKNQRERKAGKIAERGEFAGLAAHLKQLEKNYNINSETAERFGALAPEEITDAYVNVEKSAWISVLGSLSPWRDASANTRETAEGKIPVWEEQIQKIKDLRQTNPDAFKKQRWRIKPLNESIANAKTFRDERLSELEGMQGINGPLGPLNSTLLEDSGYWLNLGGPGKSIFDTQNTIRELGIDKVTGAKTVEEEDKSELLALTEKQLREEQQRRLIDKELYKTLQQFSASYPLMGAFAAGGVALVGEKGPELAHLPSGTRVHSAEDTAGMLTPTVVVNGDIVQKPGDHRDPVEVIVGDRRFAVAVQKAITSSRVTPGGRGVGRP